MPVYGLQGSYTHGENGMVREDMVACTQVANTLNEVIIFRSTGPWSQRWIKKDYPTKNFHVKGKSSDWGPQAGFVPYRGMYSKVGGNTEKEKDADDANNDGLRHQYTQKADLCLTLEELTIQRNEVSADRTAITDMIAITGSRDFQLFARRTLDQQLFEFRAVWWPQAGTYRIYVMDNQAAYGGIKLRKSLLVMTSSEVGAMNKPLTGDYDLMAICPTWRSYGSRSESVISKAGINFGRHGGAEPGAEFGMGHNMDAVLDMRTNTGMITQTVMVKGKAKAKTYGKKGVMGSQYDALAKSTPGMSREHVDMGNITPRILRCINYLNTAMGQDGPFRRVHHNAESHRNTIFGGITGKDMKTGEAFPLTLFQPSSLLVNTPVAYYTNCATLETLGEFKAYAKLLHQAGYFVPRSWTWGMSIRDEANDMFR